MGPTVKFFHLQWVLWNIFEVFWKKEVEEFWKMLLSCRFTHAFTISYMRPEKANILS